MIGVLSNKLKTRRIMKKTMFMFAAALLMVACSNEDVAVNDDVQYVSELKLNFGGGDSRVAATHSAAGLKFAWEEGDVVRVRPISNINAKHEFTYNKSTDSFVADNVNGGLTVGQEYIAEFGYQFTVTSETAATGVLVAAVSDGFGNNLPMVSEKFTAEAENTFATMRHIVGVVEVPVKASTGTLSLVDIQLTNSYGYYYYGWAGTYDVDLSTKEMTIRDSQGDSYRKLTFDGGKSISTEGTSIFIPVVPMQNVEGVMLQYKLAGKESSKNLYYDEKPLTVERGKITKIDEATLIDY